MERELPLNDCKSDGVGTDEYFGVLMNTRSLEIISTVKSLWPKDPRIEMTFNLILKNPKGIPF